MKLFLHPLLFLLLLVSCSPKLTNNDEKTLATETSAKADTLITTRYYTDLNRLVNMLDSTLNPYLVQNDNDKATISCAHITSVQERAKCVIGQFQRFEPPIHVGPVPVPSTRNSKALDDSVFIAVCMNDTEYFKEDPMDRTSGYCFGKLIDQTENYYLCLILFQFSVGQSYGLYSISKNGEFIANKTLGDEGSDSYSIFGIMKDKTHFQTDEKEIGYKNELSYFKNTEIKKYRIEPDGTFVEE